MSDGLKLPRATSKTSSQIGTIALALLFAQPAKAQVLSANRLESIAAMAAGEVPVAAQEPRPALLAQNSTVVPLPARPGAANSNAPRELEIVVPLSERGSFLGDLPIIIINEEPVFDLNRVADLLVPFAAPSTIDRLRARAAKGKATIADLTALDIKAVWDPGALAIDVIIGAADKERRTIEIVDRERREAKGFAKPAMFSVAANLRTSLDYVHQGFDKGPQDPFVDASIFGRIAGISFENEVIYDTGGFGLRRNASRLLWDFEESGVRVLLGDIRPPVRSFQSSQEALGLSIFSARQTLQPYRNFQPRGDQSFTLNEASNVDVIINGRTVRRLRLDSGQYNLTDFPFLDGQNRIQFIVEDRTGWRELGSFDVFFDRSLLEPGLSDWAVSLGSTSTRGLRGPEYDTGLFSGSGFFRSGISNTWTAGANLALLGERGLVGAETLWATQYGVVSADVGFSWGKGDTGAASTLTFQRAPANEPGKDRVQWGLSAQARSEFFNPATDYSASNSQALNLAAFWSRSFGDRYSLNLNAAHAWARNNEPNRFSASVGVGARLTQSIGINTDLSWEDTRQGDRFALRIQLTSRFGRGGSVTSSYETRENRASVSSQRSGQSRLGSWSVNGDLQRTDNSSSVNGGAFLAGGRGEVGLSHTTALNGDLTDITDQRTSLRLAAAVGFADGAVAFGRPVYSAFAIVRPHRTLGNRTVLVDYNGQGSSGYATSRIFGPPLVGDILVYARRELKLDVDDLPAGYDLGTGSIALRAAFGSGYNLLVGSADNLTVIGRALNADGDPIPFIAGTAKRTGKPDAPALELFTNGSGTFSATGLGPGQWVVTLNTQPEPTILQFILAKEGGSLRRVGDLKGTPP